MPELDEEGRWTASEASLFLGFHETRGRAAMIEKHVRDENERQARPRWVPTQRFSPVKAPPQPVSAWAPAPPGGKRSRRGFSTGGATRAGSRGQRGQ